MMARPMFSDLVQRFQIPLNSLYRERTARVTQGKPVMDLISGDVTSQNILFPPPLLEKALLQALPQVRQYRPDPMGQELCRQAISNYYQSEGLSVSASHIVVTPGSSLAYWYLFKTLANAGDEILCPRPSYPLFESIAALCGLKLVPYPLRAAERWHIDLEQLASAISPKTRAIVLISPHNPTGAVATLPELQEIAALAVQHGLPIIADEVFNSFLFVTDRFPRVASQSAPLVFTLNGFSKMLALPGLKIGWIAVTGDPSLVEKVLRTLELLSDTFLPVSELAQAAAPRLLAESPSFLQAYRSDIRLRRDLSVGLLSKSARLSFVPPEGGFYQVVKILNPGVDEDVMALDLLARNGILIHPGYFYDLEPPHFVFSFVSETAILQDALGKIIQYFSA